MRILVILGGLGLFFVGLLITGFCRWFHLAGMVSESIDLTLIDKPTLMTAAYKVYGNSTAVGGKYWLAKLTIGKNLRGPVH